MELFIFSLNVVLPLFLNLFMGYFLKKIRLINDNFTNVANALCFKVALPILLFFNIYNIDDKSVFDFRLVLFALVSIILITLVMVILTMLFTKDNQIRGVLVQCSFRSNYILFGIPLCMNLFGDKGVGVSAMLIMFVIPIFNILAVIVLSIFSKDKTQKRSFGKIFRNILTNPLIIGAFLGFVFVLFDIRLPVFADRTLKDIGQIATPLALLSLGGQFEFSNMLPKLKYVVFGTAFRIVIVPLVMLIISVFVGFRGYELGTLFIMFASPVAVSSFVMAEQMEADGELAGLLVVSTTVFSSVTIFLFIYALKALMLI